MRTALPGRLRPGRLRPGRLRLWAVCGLAGPALFTLAWVVSSLRLIGPGFSGESWHNQAHDVASGLAYAMMIAAPPVLAWRFHREPDWAALSRPLQVLTLISAASLALFASRSAVPWNGTVQRLAVP